MRAAASLMIGSLLLGGCGLAPEPIPIYEDARVLVRLLYDPQAGTGHSHPATLTSEQIAAALQGARIQNRDALGLGGLFREAGSAPAFSAGEIAVLARHLAAALRKASPKDLATFYLATMDPALGRLVTSGGLFVRQGKLYLILANARTSPTAVQYENTHPIDQRDQPLLPIVPLKFVAGFHPPEAWIPNREVRGRDGYGGYLDESKLLVINLERLGVPASGSPAAPQP
jgi:hypothetical protein